MNALAKTEIPLPDALLNLAEWLNSQSTLHHVCDARLQGISVGFPGQINMSTEWNHVLRTNCPEFPGYYSMLSTNPERVLAVLTLREMILNGDA